MKQRASIIKTCALALLVCFFTVIALSSIALTPFESSKSIGYQTDQRGSPSRYNESIGYSRSLSSALRRETIRALPANRRWTREACAEHWAKGIERLVFEKVVKKRIFLAMNLKDNEEVFDHLRGELLLLADYLGPSRLYISIYESGSLDSTPDKLRAFRDDLRLLRIPNTITWDGPVIRPDQTRIEFLARARNLALAPLLKQVWDGPYGNPDAGIYFPGNGCFEALTAIEVYATDSQIFGIQFSFGGVRKGRMGTPRGKRFELRLAAHETITVVEGAGEKWLNRLVFKTSTGRKLAAGDLGALKGWESKGGGLEDVTGFASEGGIHALSFAWAGGSEIGPRFDRVIFLNDGYLCVEDILLLLTHDDVTVATAVDTIGLREAEHTRSLMVYDTWVGRDLDGREQGRHFPLSNIPKHRQWFIEGKPIPVFCACHGGVNIDARVFYDQHITFRNRGWEGECAASEYSLLCKDIWRAYGNRTKVVMDPRIVIGVDKPAWEDVTLARLKKLPGYFKEPPFDVGIQPSPWRTLPAIDRSVVENSLTHLEGLDYVTPRHVTCAPIHHESHREAALIGKYDEDIRGVNRHPRGPWKKDPTCVVGSDAYLSRHEEPGKSMFYFNSAGHQKITRKRLYLGGGDRLVSPDFRYMLLMQTNRECVMYTLAKTPAQPIWEWPMCDDPSILYIEFQDDGNLVAYADGGTPKHATGTVEPPRKAAYMALENDGTLVLKTKGGRTLWEAERTFLVEGSDWKRGPPGKQLFIPITFGGDDFEIEAAAGLGDLCRAFAGRVFFSLVHLKGASSTASQSVANAVLLEYMCSYQNSGVATNLDEAKALHFVSYANWTTGHAYSCAKSFPLKSSEVCLKDFVQDARRILRRPSALEPCTREQMDGSSDREWCCSGPTYD